MGLSSQQRMIAESLGKLGLTNPFGQERLELESQILSASQGRNMPWHRPVDWGEDDATLVALEAASKEMLGLPQEEMSDRDLELMGKVALYSLYYQYENKFYQAIVDQKTGQFRFYDQFRQDHEKICSSWPLPDWALVPERLFALFFQSRRAFHFIFHQVLGTSRSIANLRKAVWESLFTYDMEQYIALLSDTMHEMTTLILGPSGSGKELVASAIGYGSYIPFDPASKQFVRPFQDAFVPIHIASFNESLVESELFGHCKGAFTGAVSDRAGYLENRRPYDTVFLDEIAEVSASTQVKLLRVLQNRQFMRIGDNTPITFNGRIVAATHRNLEKEIARGAFREDLYYRLRSNIIETPSLDQILNDDPNELDTLVQMILQRLLGPGADPIVENTVERIHASLGQGYHWPGNMRELEQCVRNVLLHGAYTKPRANEHREMLLGQARPLEEAISLYISSVYSQNNSYTETAELLEIDRRTVAKYVEKKANKIP